MNLLELLPPSTIRRAKFALAGFVIGWLLGTALGIATVWRALVDLPRRVERLEHAR